MIIVRFGEKEIDKENFYTAQFLCRDVNVDNTVTLVSKLIATKTISNLIGIKFDKVIRTFKVKEGDNKLLSFRIDNEKLLKKYNPIWAKIEDL